MGWLRIARSRWEVLGCGHASFAREAERGVGREIEWGGLLDGVEGGERDGAGEREGALLSEGERDAAAVLGERENAAAGVQWMVTYARKSLFTPAGVNLCCRLRGGLPVGVQRELEMELAGLGDEGVGGLVREMFAVRHE